MKTIYNIILAFSILIGGSAYGQNPHKKGENNQPTLEKLEKMRGAFVLKKLDLNEREKAQFGPLYKKYRKEYLQLVKGSEKMEHKRPTEEDILKMTDSEAKLLIENDLAQKRKILNHKEKYFNEFSKIMSHKQVALLFQAEIDFHRKLFKRMRKRGERKENRKP